MNEELVQAIDNATVAHALWKARLSGAVGGDGAVFDKKIATDSHACEFGKWLDGNRNLSGSHPEYERIHQHHEAFHVALGECLDKLAAGRGSEVRQSLAADGKFRNLSGRMVLELLHWRDRLMA